MNNEKRRKGYAVIGLGNFGRAIAKTLAEAGEAIIAIDSNPKLVELCAETVDHVFRADATDIKALEEAGVASVDTAVVTIGDHLEPLVLAVMNLKSLGVPHIKARANSPVYRAVLDKLGVEDILNPDEDMGEYLAEKLMNPSLSMLVSLNRDCNLVEIPVPALWAGHSLKELGIRNKYNINVIGIRLNGSKDITLTVDPDRFMNATDILVMIGDKKSFRKLNLEQ